MSPRVVPSSAREYQLRVFSELQRLFGERNVRKEWDVAKDSRDDYTRKLYCPRIDIAVGPFNIDRKIERNWEEFNRAIHDHRAFIEALISASDGEREDPEAFLDRRNMNPRCLLAIELEGSGSRKHMFGDIANASIIGAIGIVVPLNESRLRCFRRMKKYIEFATTVGKLEEASFRNVLVIDKDRFLHTISGEFSGVVASTE